jgi:radical SAM superfamily enzyme YgiQ (UPF0313 family)
MPLAGSRPIVLINPLYRKNWEYIENNPAAVLPLGVLSIGTVLAEKGYPVKIIDACTNPDYLTEIEKSMDSYPLFIGISAMTAQVYSALNIARLIRQKDINAEIPIVWGGIHPTIFPQETAENHCADIIIEGAGEYTSLRLAQELSVKEKPDFTKIPGITYRENGRLYTTAPGEFIDINTLPFINYDLLDAKKYIHRKLGYGGNTLKRSLILYTGSGCPFRCTFCANVALHKRRYSGKTAQRILKEIDFFTKKYNVEYISFCDELFFVNKKRIQEFLDGLEKMDCKIEWYANVRADCFRPDFLNEEMVSKMKQLGCHRLGMGVESGSQRILDEILKKDIKLDDVLAAARLCAKYDITVGYSFMMGLPGEMHAETIKTLHLMGKLKKMHPCCFFFGPQIYIPFPGSELYKTAVRLGFKEPRDLQGWADVEKNKSLEGKLSGEYLWNSFDPSKLPWVKNVGLIKHIDFMQNFLFRDIKSIEFNFKYPGKVLLVLVARFRVKFKFWSFPFEFWAYRAVVSIKRR